MADVALKDEKWWIQDFSLPTRSWHEGRAPLALFLSDSEWRTVARAFEEMDVTNGAVWALNADLEGLIEAGEAAPVKGEPGRKRLKMIQTATVDAIWFFQGSVGPGGFRVGRTHASKASVALSNDLTDAPARASRSVATAVT